MEVGKNRRIPQTPSIDATNRASLPAAALVTQGGKTAQAADRYCRGFRIFHRLDSPKATPTAQRAP